MRTIWTDTAIAAAERMLDEGCSYEHVGRALGLRGWDVSRKFPGRGHPRPDAHSSTVDREAVFARVRAGVSRQQIANEFGISPTTVSRWCRSAGLAIPRHLPPRRRFSEAEKALALALLQDGCSYCEVARTLGTSHSPISRMFPGFGWTADDGAKFESEIIRLSQDDLLPSRAGSKYNREPVYWPFVRRLTRVERERLAA